MSVDVQVDITPSQVTVTVENDVTVVSDVLPAVSAAASAAAAAASAAAAALSETAAEAAEAAAQAWATVPVLQAGGVIFAHTDGSLTADATKLSWNTATSTLAVTGTLTVSTLTAGRVPYAGVGGALSDSASLTWNNGTTTLSAPTVTATAQHLGPLGSTGTPTYSFTGNTNTGIYSRGAGELSFSAGGGIRAYMNASNTTLMGPLVLTSGVYLSRYAAKQVMISGDGTGAGANGGLILGYFGTDFGSIWSSYVVPTFDNYMLVGNATETYLNAATGGTLGIRIANTSKLTITASSISVAVPAVPANDNDATNGILGSNSKRWRDLYISNFIRAGTTGGTMGFVDVAGGGPYITAGTATTDVNALSISQTFNNAAVTFTAMKVNVTDTTSNIASKLMDLQNGGASQFSVSKVGTVVAGGSITAAAATYLGLNGRAYFAAPGTGIIRLSDWSGGDFDRLQFGGTTSSYPSLKRSSATLQARLADDSADAAFRSSTLTLSAAATSAGAGTITYGGTTQSTVGAAGGASALPATPTGYAIINVAGTDRVVPYYDAS